MKKKVTYMVPWHRAISAWLQSQPLREPGEHRKRLRALLDNPLCTISEATSYQWFLNYWDEYFRPDITGGISSPAWGRV